MAAAATRKQKALGDAASDEGQPFYARATPTLLAETEPDPKSTKPTAEEQKEWAALYQHFESRMQALYTWRLSWWSTASQIARYLRPDRFFAFVTANTYNQGLRRDFHIVDRTGTLAGETTAAGLMAGLTDPDRVWLMLGPAIPGFELDQAGQQWYADVTERLNYIYTHSNFYDMQAQGYSDLVFFGTAPFIDYADEENIINVKVPSSGEYMLGTGFDNSDEVFYEENRMTVNQIVEGFGIENCADEIQKMWRQKGGALQTEYVVGHAIEPNFAILGDQEKATGVVPGGFTWREAFWLRAKKDARPLSMAGFREQPHSAARWNVRGNEAYGRGVGENMLGDVIQLQLETKQKAESIEKVNRPPMGADVSLQNLPASTNPGKITYFNTGQNGEKKFFPLYEVKPDIPAITADILLIQERINKTAYVDVMQPMADLREQTKGTVTATEIDAIKQERLLPLGPVFGRVYGSLRSRVKRHLAIMNRRGLIPPKPPSLRGVPTKIDFVSMLTAAQKATSTAAIARSAQFIGSLSGAWPEARFMLDVEKTVRDFNDGVGAPPDNLVSPQTFKKLVAAAEQQSKAAAATQATLPGAQAAKALSEAKTGPGNALSALVGGG